MKRNESVLGVLGAFLVTVCALWISRHSAPTSNLLIEQRSCHIPITTLKPDVSYGSAVIIHGLAGNRVVMRRIGDELARNGIQAYLVDLPGHGINSDSFSFARAEQCAAIAVESLLRDRKISADRMAIIGHSMGAAIGIRLADRLPTIATVAISPAPMILPRRMPSNLLVFSAQFDLPALRRASLALEQASGGGRSNPSDFVERRAFELQRIRAATHTSLLFEPYTLGQIIRWIRRAVGAPVKGSPATAVNLQIAAMIGLSGLAMCFPAAATLVVRLFRAHGSESASGGPRNFMPLAQWAVAALLGVSVLHFFVPLRFVRLLTGDYLASLLLITGIALLALLWGTKEVQWGSNIRPGIAAAFLAIVAFLIAGAWLSWQLTEVWLTSARWLRFVVLAPVVFPYSLAEEIALGAVNDHRRRRFVLFLTLRLLVWLACILALYVFASGQVLVLILVLYLAGFSIVERLAIDTIRQRTGSLEAAAIFGTMLTAWFIAAVFPLT